ncbi:MAG: AAA family ATPase [Clostridia bacterium]|nr:AAA family ATPase [Clostridia bacterium]
MNILYIRGLRINWDTMPLRSYVWNIPSIANTSSLDFTKNVTFFVGENGSGKSTLLEAIASSFGYNPEGGTRNYHFSTFDDLSDLSQSLTLIKGVYPKFGYFFRAETFYNVATTSIVEYGGNDYHSNSHGEGHLEFLSFDGPGLYIMDEPEAALSPQRQLALLKHVYDLAKKGAQFIIATHSPILLSCPNAEIFSFDEGKITNCRYEETLCYVITKRFLNDKDRMLKNLLGE